MLTKPIEYNIPITPDTAVKMALNLSTKTIYYVDDNGIIQIVGSVASNSGVFNNVTITGGTIQGVALTLDSLDNTPIGSNTPSTGRFTTLTTTGLASFNSMSTANATITGGTIQGVALTLDSLDNTPIGATTPSTGAFTTLSASGVFTSTVATGTSPFSIASTTVVPNLNVSQLLGNTWAVPGAIGSTTPNSGAFTILSANSVTNTTPVLSFNASNTIAAFGSTTANSYNQLIIQNKSGTSGASANYVISNDIGTDSTYYGEFGMNSSVFSASTPSDFFSINNGVYFSGHDGDLTYGSGNGFKSYFAWGATANSAHVINTSGAIGLSTNLGTTPALSGTTGFGTAGQVMISNGSGAANSWSSTPTLVGTNFTGIPNGALTNSSITFGSTAVALGATVSGFNGVNIGATTAGTGAFTTLSASSTVSGAGFSTYLAAPPAIGSTTPNTGSFTSILAAGTVTGTTLVATNSVNTPNTFGFKNRIINGAMFISQRGTSFSGTSSIYTLDRWKWQIPTSGGVTQITSTISGFAYSWKYISTGSNSYMQMGQQIEYSNFYDCAGQTVTISFWAKANNTNSGSTALIGRMRYLTSVDGACIFAGINTDTSITISTTATKYTFTYSVPSNAQSLSCEFVLNSNVSGDGFEITGVQLEKGTTATSFDYRPYSTELALCQRYCLKLQDLQNMGGVSSASTQCQTRYAFPVTMRAAPTASITTAGSWQISDDYTGDFTASTVSIVQQQLGVEGGRLYLGGFTGLINGRWYASSNGAGTAVICLSAEL